MIAVAGGTVDHCAGVAAADAIAAGDGAVGIVEIQRPPHNFFDNSLINQIADAFEAFDRDINIRAYVLCAQGKSFCAGADLKERDGMTDQAWAEQMEALAGELCARINARLGRNAAR